MINAFNKFLRSYFRVIFVLSLHKGLKGLCFCIISLSSTTKHDKKKSHTRKNIQNYMYLLNIFRFLVIIFIVSTLTSQVVMLLWMAAWKIIDRSRIIFGNMPFNKISLFSFSCVSTHLRIHFHYCDLININISWDKNVFSY